MIELTKPELATAKRDRNRVARFVAQRGPCWCCLHRVQGFGVVACTIPGRTYPLCQDKPVVTFTLDESTLPPPLKGQRP